MLTPQDVSTHVFQKARMGGYNMAMVDEFLDILTVDYTTLYKENAALKSKLKVLVDKIEEYRATEDSMRATLLTAQKMASQMVQDAEKQKAEMLKDAEAAAMTRKVELTAELTAEAERLKKMHAESAAFIANMRRLCNSELEFLDNIGIVPPESAIAEAAAAVAEKTAMEEQVQDIESSVMSATADVEETEETTEPEPAALDLSELDEAAEAAEEAAPAEEDAPVEEEAPYEEPEDLSATRRIDFGDLKFGRNYKKNK